MAVDWGVGVFFRPTSCLEAQTHGEHLVIGNLRSQNGYLPPFRDVSWLSSGHLIISGLSCSREATI